MDFEMHSTSDSRLLQYACRASRKKAALHSHSSVPAFGRAEARKGERERERDLPMPCSLGSDITNDKRRIIIDGSRVETWNATTWQQSLWSSESSRTQDRHHQLAPSIRKWPSPKSKGHLSCTRRPPLIRRDTEPCHATQRHAQRSPARTHGR